MSKKIVVRIPKESDMARSILAEAANNQAAGVRSAVRRFGQPQSSSDSSLRPLPNRQNTGMAASSTATSSDTLANPRGPSTRCSCLICNADQSASSHTDISQPSSLTIPSSRYPSSESMLNWNYSSMTISSMPAIPTLAIESPTLRSISAPLHLPLPQASRPSPPPASSQSEQCVRMHRTPTPYPHAKLSVARSYDIVNIEVPNPPSLSSFTSSDLRAVAFDTLSWSSFGQTLDRSTGSIGSSLCSVPFASNVVSGASRTPAHERDYPSNRSSSAPPFSCIRVDWSSDLLDRIDHTLWRISLFPKVSSLSRGSHSLGPRSASASFSPRQLGKPSRIELLEWRALAPTAQGANTNAIAVQPLQMPGEPNIELDEEVLQPCFNFCDSLLATTLEIEGLYDQVNVSDLEPHHKVQLTARLRQHSHKLEIAAKLYQYLIFQAQLGNFQLSTQLEFIGRMKAKYELVVKDLESDKEDIAFLLEMLHNQQIEQEMEEASEEETSEEEKEEVTEGEKKEETAEEEKKETTEEEKKDVTKEEENDTDQNNP